MKRLFNFCIISVLCLFLASGLLANGLNLNGVGSKAIGMGGAFIGLADDYSAIFWNPAGLTQLKESSLSLFQTNLLPKGTYKFDLAGVDAETESKIYPNGALTYFKPVSEKMVIGIGVYVPSGTGGKWNGDDFRNLVNGQSYEWESFLGIVTLSPAFAYQVSDTFSFGATLNFNYGLMKLKRPGLGQYEENISGFSFGATFGVLFKPSEQFSIGATLRTPSKVKFSGDADMSMASAYQLETTSDATRETTWPLWGGIGIAYKPTEKLTITADMQYTNWKKIDIIGIDYDNPIWQAMKAHPQLGAAFNNDFELNWDDAIQWRFGLEYKVSDSFALRGGFYIDPSPSPPETLNVLLPEIDYNAVTIGFGYQTEKFKLDFCFEYLMGKDQDSPLTGTMPGTHGMSIMVPNIALTFVL